MPSIKILVLVFSFSFITLVLAQRIPGPGGMQPAPAGITLVSGQILAAQSSSDLNTGFGVSFPTGATIGNTVVYAAGGYLVSATSFVGSDNQTNTYVMDNSRTSTGDSSVYINIGHSDITATGSPFTVSSTPSPISGYPGIIAAEYSGLLGTLDVTSNGSGSGTSVTCGSLTTTTANELIVASVENYTAGYTPGSGFTILGSAGTGGVSIAMEARIVSSTGTYSPTFTLASSGAWACTAAAYK